MIGRARLWLLTHPRAARPVKVMGLVQLLSCVAVGTAPHALASTNAVVLNWTGLHDNYGDDSIDARHGKVIAGRQGEAWVLDEFGGFGKVRLFAAPTAELAALYDTNPVRGRQRARTARP